MMNLNAIVSSIVAPVNPITIGQIMVSAGYVTDANYVQQPSYVIPTNIKMQVQALTAKEIEHLDSINIQGIMRAVYLNGNIEGQDRILGKGGDLLVIGGVVWLVTTVLESWDANGWTKVAVTKQIDNGASYNVVAEGAGPLVPFGTMIIKELVASVAGAQTIILPQMAKIALVYVNGVLEPQECFTLNGATLVILSSANIEAGDGIIVLYA